MMMKSTTTRWLAAAAVVWLVLMSQPDQAVAWPYWPVWSWGWPNWTDIKVDFACYKEMYDRISKLNPGTWGVKKIACALDACGFRQYTGGWWPLGFLEEDMRTS